MLWRDDRLDDVGNVIYVGKGFDAEENVVEGLLGRVCGIFGCSDDCIECQKDDIGKVARAHIPA